MQLTNALSNFQRNLVRNSPTILTAGGISGVVVTAYLSGRASYKAGYDDGVNYETHGTSENRTERVKAAVKRHWHLYTPVALAGAVSIGCVVGAHRAHNRRTAAAQALLAVSERAFAEYRDKFAEHYGAKKDQSLRDEIAQDRVTKNPPPAVLMHSDGFICKDAYSGRYFTSDMETLRRAQNDLNEKLFGGMATYVTLSDFYDKIGLDHTHSSSAVGWEVPKQLKLEFSTCLHEGRPVMVVDYNYIKSL